MVSWETPKSLFQIRRVFAELLLVTSATLLVTSALLVVTMVFAESLCRVDVGYIPAVPEEGVVRGLYRGCALNYDAHLHLLHFHGFTMFDLQ